MAMSSWIESADSRYRPARPTFTEGVDRTHVLANPRGTSDAEQAERDAAAVYIRRLANRHGCAGRCDRPEHARDVDAAREWLDALFGEMGPARRKGRT